MINTIKEVKLRTITNFAASDAYREAIHSLIPGGAHTYSKGDDQFPLLSPAAIAYGRGAYIWDIDGNMFLDCPMGLTSVSLGHAYEPVLRAIVEELSNGVNFQRPSALEKVMAEKFLSLVPVHNRIKFSKNGSIVTTAAVKLARAKTGRDLVAFPKDHPFYSYDDWFIGTTPCNKGVPDQISNLSVTFQSYDIESVKAMFETYKGQISCVITEPEKSDNRTEVEKEVYIRELIELTHQNGALFIMDEMVTGFKTGFPGSISKWKLEPDMATWGKGIANGFSFCALTGKSEVMDLGGINNIGEEKVFLISTTHGGETHTMASAVATIDTFIENDVVNHNQKIGDQLISLCSSVIKANDLEDYIKISLTNWLVGFSFYDSQMQLSNGMRTLVMQEMIKRGVLFQGAFVPCFSHCEEDVMYFAKAFDESLLIYKSALETNFENFLVGKPAKPVFRKFL